MMNETPRIAAQHLRQRRNRRRPVPRNSKRRDGDRSGSRRPAARARAAERAAIGPRAVGRALERRVVVHDDDVVARQVDVELEAVGAERQAVIERREVCSRDAAPRRRDARRPAVVQRARRMRPGHELDLQKVEGRGQKVREQGPPVCLLPFTSDRLALLRCPMASPNVGSLGALRKDVDAGPRRAALR